MPVRRLPGRPPGRRSRARSRGRLPLERGAWRIDETVHPFAIGIGISDLRITTRFDPRYVGTSLWAVIHEVGHALYQNGIAPELERTPLCRSVSLGFDESQSRLWENWVGRGRPFLAHLRPLLAEAFPKRFDGRRRRDALPGGEPGRALADPRRGRRGHLQPPHRAALRARGGAVRGSPRARRPARGLGAADARATSGIEVPDDASGVLQDVHWAAGSFGYFPTYSLGNVIAAQLWELVRGARCRTSTPSSPPASCRPLRELPRRA